MEDWASFLWSVISHPESSSAAAAKHAAEAAASTAEELGEEIFSRHAAGTSSALFQSGLTILVVDLTFLRVRKGFVSVGKLFEFLFCLCVARVLVFQFVSGLLA